MPLYGTRYYLKKIKVSMASAQLMFKVYECERLQDFPGVKEKKTHNFEYMVLKLDEFVLIV